MRSVSLPPVITWAVTDDGLSIYRDGQLVAVIPPGSFGRLIYAMAEKMRG